MPPPFPLLPVPAPPATGTGRSSRRRQVSRWLLPACSTPFCSVARARHSRAPHRRARNVDAPDHVGGPQVPVIHRCLGEGHGSDKENDRCRVRSSGRGNEAWTPG